MLTETGSSRRFTPHWGEAAPWARCGPSREEGTQPSLPVALRLAAWLCFYGKAAMAVPGSDPQLSPGPRPRRRTAVRWPVFVALAALTAVILAGVVIDLSSHDNTAVIDPLVDRTDKPAPAFSLPELVNPRRSMTLTEFGGKPLVINFWASWCFPCQTEMPLLESAYRSEHGAVQFLGIDTDDKRGAAIRFLGHVHVTYPSLFMPQRGPVAVSYDLVGLPITIFISSNGTIVGRHIGQLNGPTLRAALKLAFGPEAGA